MKRKWLYYSISFLMIAGAFFFVYRRWTHDVTPSGEPPRAVPAAIEEQVQREKNAQPSPSKPETVVMKTSMGGVKDPLSDVENEVMDVAQAELEKVRIDMFKTEAMETLPLLTLHTADPLQPDKPGPKLGEVWIRIKPSYSRETRDVMAQVSDLYRSTVRPGKPVTVMLWVGGQPMALFESDQWYNSIESHER